MELASAATTLALSSLSVTTSASVILLKAVLAPSTVLQPHNNGLQTAPHNIASIQTSWTSPATDERPDSLQTAPPLTYPRGDIQFFTTQRLDSVSTHRSSLAGSSTRWSCGSTYAQPVVAMDPESAASRLPDVVNIPSKPQPTNSGETIEERCFSAALVCLEGHYTQEPPMGPKTTARVNSIIAKTLEKTHTCRKSRYG